MGNLETKMDSLNRDIDRVAMMEALMNQLESVSGAAWGDPWSELQQMKHHIEWMKVNIQGLMDKESA